MDGANHPLHGIFFYTKNLKFSELTLKSELTSPLITLKFRKEAKEFFTLKIICHTKQRIFFLTKKTLECVAETKLRISISVMTYSNFLVI